MYEHADATRQSTRLSQVSETTDRLLPRIDAPRRRRRLPEELGVIVALGLLIGTIGALKPAFVDPDNLLATPQSVFFGLGLPILLGGVVLLIFVWSLGWLREIFGRQPIARSWWMWIAVALVIFAFWRADLCLVGAYLFGAYSALPFLLQSRGWLTGVPDEVFIALPYVMTIVVLVAAVAVGRVVARAAEHLVPTVAAEHHVSARLAEQEVVSGRAGEEVVPVLAVHSVRAGTAGQGVVTGAAEHLRLR